MGSVANVDWTLLLAAAQRFAQILGAEALPEAELRRCVERVLFGREALAAARLGLITQRELVDLVLAHLYELLRDRADMQPDGEPWLDEELLHDMHRALFGLDQ